MPSAAASSRIGVIRNPRSHRNRVREGADPVPPGVLCAAPRGAEALRRTLAEFADAGVDLLVVDGGDGTVRDVLTSTGTALPARMAVVPSGKTNALALDLGVPADWTLADVVRASAQGGERQREPIEVHRQDGSPPKRGFLFGTGAFVAATGLAQRTHKAGAFNGLAVGLSIGWAVAQTALGGAGNSWRAGERMRIATPAQEVDRAIYLFLASTLCALPVGVKPFGRPREGLKTLTIDAPPRRLLRMASAVLRGSEGAWLETVGCRREDADTITLSVAHGFVLDGELYDGGDITLRRGPPVTFVVP